MRDVRAWWVVAWLALDLVCLGTEVRAGPRYKVAVFDLQASESVLDPGAGVAMADHLASSTAKTGRFQVIPREGLRAALTAEEGEGDNACVDPECLMSVAGRLGAQFGLLPSVSREGEGCALSLSLLDASGRALVTSMFKNKCMGNYVAVAVDGALLKLILSMDEKKSSLDATAKAQAAQQPKDVPVEHIEVEPED